MVTKQPLNDTRWRASYRVPRTSRTPGSAVEGPYKGSWHRWTDALIAAAVTCIIAGIFLFEWLPTVVAAVVKIWRMS